MHPSGACPILITSQNSAVFQFEGGISQDFQGRQKLVPDRFAHRDVDGRGDDVVARLPHVQHGRWDARDSSSPGLAGQLRALGLRSLRSHSCSCSCRSPSSGNTDRKCASSLRRSITLGGRAIRWPSRAPRRASPFVVRLGVYAHFTSPSARMNSREMIAPADGGKLSTACCVDAPVEGLSGHLYGAHGIFFDAIGHKGGMVPAAITRAFQSVWLV